MHTELLAKIQYRARSSIGRMKLAVIVTALLMTAINAKPSASSPTSEDYASMDHRIKENDYYIFDREELAEIMAENAPIQEGEEADIQFFGLISDIVNGITRLVNSNRRRGYGRGHRRG